MTNRPAPMTLTDDAIARIQAIMAEQKDPDIIGLRIGTNNKGCNGMSYTLDFVHHDKVDPLDEKLEHDGFTLFVEGSSLLYLIGIEMDFVIDKMGAHFKFNNPNADSYCGCGESFNVRETDA